MPDEEKNPEPVLFPRGAARLGLLLLAALVGVAIFSRINHARRESLESVSAPTAVGDTHFVTPPATPGKPLGLFGGHSLVGGERVKARDSRMTRVGSDDAHTFSIYSLDDPEAGARKTDSGAGAVYFLKIAGGEYLRVSAQ